ncbi:serine hydrolase domain-containing protein [Actinokineospora pegani]|uniref:serine hydrolase domain-containing protein n=1 Tax=Actinokineospora pegani TaxID=2654637 RepID=UPI0012E9AF6F|nr:serine hydrolase domain-containing protein [Actinokineospora pegani]
MFSAPRLDRWRTRLARTAVPLVAAVDRAGETHVTCTGGLTRDSIFRISSMTKPVTAVAALCLVEDTVLRLDDPVDPWLPELAGVPVLRSLSGLDTEPLARPITVRDLMNSTFGHGQLLDGPDVYPVQALLADAGFPVGPPRPDETHAPDEYMARLGSVPLMAQPGSRWFYNTAYDVLGILVQRAAGASLGAFMRERVFDPLGMVDTGFSVDQADLPRLSTSYLGDDVFDPPGGAWSRPPALESGAGGLVSTVDDYLRFGRMLLAGGGDVLSPASVALMTSDQLTDEQKVDTGFLDFTAFTWGFGVSVVLRRTDVFMSPGRFGWDGGLGTSSRMDPELDVTTVLLTQHLWTSPAGPRLAHDADVLAYGALA